MSQRIEFSKEFFDYANISHYETWRAAQIQVLTETIKVISNINDAIVKIRKSITE